MADFRVVERGVAGVDPQEADPHIRLLAEHLRNVLSRVRELVDRVDPHRFQILEVIFGHLFGESFDRHILLGCFVNQFVIDIGDVDDVGDIVAEVTQLPFDGVEDHRSHHVAYVAGLVDRGATKVDADLGSIDGFERLFGARQGVVYSDHFLVALLLASCLLLFAVVCSLLSALC